MLELKGYEVKELIHEGEEIAIYRGFDIKEEKPVVIKTNRLNYFFPRIISQIHYEYDIAQNLDSKGILKPYKLEKYLNGIALIFEDNGGKSLGSFLKTEKVDFENFLKIAISLAQTIGEIHSQNIIHKDIKPQNILILPSSLETKIIDFGISSKISLKFQNLGNPDILEGTLAYISPEQTGRMNRVVDYRTDFYSLGILFYEVITGKLPFNSDDSMELVHFHLAVQPPSPSQINTEIPEVISLIIMKLISKNAENRYQSGFGLKADLEECLHQYKTKGKIELFPLGTKDFSGRFQIPQKLYGREADTKQLMESFHKASLGSVEIMLVSGPPGVGKSVLVHEIHKPITAKRGYFISGKFDQFQKNIPYFAIREALEEFVKLLLTEKKQTLDEWKTWIMESVGENGKILIDIIPSLVLIIGEQPEVPELGPQESQIRFNLTFLSFIRAISRREHPLVLFIDDLQWADFASLNILNTILTDKDIKYIFIVCSYRDNEVDSAHPFILMMDEVRKCNEEIETIALSNLLEKDVNDLISDSLNTEPSKTNELTELVYRKTLGNAFFTCEFLKSLYEEELLTYDYMQNQWNWEIKRIADMNMTDNVIVLMTQKLAKLSAQTREVLKLASCIGSKFSLRVISIVHEKTERETLKDLWSSVEEDLSLPLDDNYKLIDSVIDSKGNKESEFKFVHDRVHQASYTLIGDDQKKEIHLKIARLLLYHISEADLADKIFDITNQFNNALDLIQNDTEKLRIAKLNLMAARKARAATAYEESKSYLDKALSILTEKTWEADYDLMLQIHHSLIEVEFLQNNPERAEKYSDIVLKKARTNSDRIRVFELKAYYFSKIGEFGKGLDTVVTALKLIGYTLKRNPGQLDVILKLLKTKMVLSRYGYEKILNLPLMKDKEKLDATKFYILGGAPAFIVGSNALPIVVFEACMLTVKNGISPYSSYAFAAYGLILCGVLGEMESGYKYGELSFKLWAKVRDPEMEPRINHVFYSLIKHWKDDLRSCIAPIQANNSIALNVGDYEYYAFSLCMYLAYKVYVGEHLKSIYEECIKYTNIYAENMEAAIQFVAPNTEYALKLMSATIPNDYELSGKYFDANKHIPLMRENNKTGLSFYYVAKIHLALLFKDYSLALVWVNESKSVIENAALAMYNQVRYYFFKGIIHAKLIENKIGDKNKHLSELNFVIKKFKKWASHCPVNHKYSYLLLKALRLGLENKYEQTSIFFEESIKLAEENGFVNDVALINELTAEYYFANDKEKIGIAYIREARKSYLAWGAQAKVTFLREKYPKIFEENTRFESRGNKSQFSSINARHGTVSDSGTTIGSTAQMDIESVVKVSQTLSGEIHLERLFQKLMKILIENSGAEKCFLILIDNDRFLIQAEGGVGLITFPTLQSLIVDNDEYLPLSVIEYVARTQESLVLKDAANEGNFTHSEYVVKNKVKSVICTPIVKQGKLFGILYLENNLVSNAFTPSRLEILRLLSSQIGISIENAMFYQNLEGKVQDRTKQLEEKTNQLEEKHQELTTLFEKLDILKIQQDGDYFLNTLMIRPLGQNNARSNNLTIEFFIKQKKKFKFRNKDYELGGDINISENIQLQDKNYIVFLNGDAMGKSVQGAGGVLVLGTVFKSIIQRTLSTASAKSVYPERWLKNAFIEMHKVFESFDGSMLMSTVFGLIDEKTGTMYFMNSEHPDMVLWRGEKVEFIEIDNLYRKLGTQGQTLNFSVQVFSLKEGDSLFMGSDGRDDVILGKEPGTDIDIVNMDETLFLSHVKKGEGVLDKIYKQIAELGELKDDLSLIKINYAKAEESEFNLDLNETLKQLEEFKTNKQFEMFTSLGEKVISDYPQITDHIRDMSIAYKELKQFEKAIDFGERVRLRDSKNMTNMINLIQCYYGAEKSGRAKTILKACLRAKPDDERLKKLKEELYA